MIKIKRIREGKQASKGKRWKEKREKRLAKMSGQNEASLYLELIRADLAHTV